MNARLEATKKVQDIYANSRLDSELKRIEKLYQGLCQSLIGYVDDVIMPAIDDEFLDNVFVHNEISFSIRQPLNDDECSLVLDIANCLHKELDEQAWELSISKTSRIPTFCLEMNVSIRANGKNGNEYSILPDYCSIRGANLDEFLSALGNIETEDDLLENFDIMANVLDRDNFEDTCSDFLSAYEG